MQAPSERSSTERLAPAFDEWCIAAPLACTATSSAHPQLKTPPSARATSTNSPKPKVSAWLERQQPERGSLSQSRVRRGSMALEIVGFGNSF